MKPLNWMRAEIERLDPAVDSERIVRLTTARLLPRSLMAVHLFYAVGFVRFAGPPVAADSADRGGGGMLYGHGNRRADETMFHLFAWIDDGASSPATAARLRQVRNWHAGVGRTWPMPMHTYQPSAALFTLVYDRLLRLVGAPGLSDTERAGQLAHWRTVSEALGATGFPQSWQGLEDWLDEYERGEYFAFSDAGRRVATALIDQFAVRWFPRPLRWFGRWLVVALSEDHVIDTLAIPRPPSAAVTAIRLAARLGVFLQTEVLPDPRRVAPLTDIITTHRRSALASRRPSGPGHASAA